MGAENRRRLAWRRQCLGESTETNAKRMYDGIVGPLVHGQVLTADVQPQSSNRDPPESNTPQGTSPERRLADGGADMVCNDSSTGGGADRQRPIGIGL